MDSDAVDPMVPFRGGLEKKARPKPTVAKTRDDLRRLIPALVANAEGFPHLEALRLELERIVDGLDEILARQSAWRRLGTAHHNFGNVF